MTGPMISSVEERRAKKIAAEEAEIAQLIEENNKPETEDSLPEPEVEDKVEDATEDEPSGDPKAEEEPTGDEAVWKKRYSDLRRSSSKTKADLEAELKELKDNPQLSEIVMPATDEEIGEWQTKYPDIARIVETLATKKAAEKFGEAEAEIESLKAANTVSAIDKMEAKIRKEVPEYDDLKESEVFLDWLDVQPKSVQNALYENTSDPDDAIFVFNLYKERTSAPDKKKKEEKDAASAVSTKSTPNIDTESTKGKVLESWVDGLTMEEFEKEEEKVLEAMRSGNFVYDLTGGAR
jgi:dipeptidyl aminopeptidase/acylaminoacyl peptidase